MEDTEFYLAQAAHCDRAASQAHLEHQREKLLTAKQAWLHLAHRVEDIRKNRLAATR